MCRTGGRRCPSSQEGADRSIPNAKKRWKYAEDRYAQVRAKSKQVSEAEDIDRDLMYKMMRLEGEAEKAVAQHKTELGRLILKAEAAHERKKFSDREIPSPEQLGFTPKDAIISGQDPDFESFQDFLGTLNTFQEADVKRYRGRFYSHLNKGLRTGDIEGQPTAVASDTDTMYAMIPTLDKLIEERSKGREVDTVYRGMGDDGVKMLMDAKDGDVLQFPSYTSTSRSAYTASEFSTFGPYDNEENKNTIVMMELRTRKGMDMLGEEMEVLLPRNTSWRVAGRYVTSTPFALRTLVVQLVDEDYLDELEKGTAKKISNPKENANV